MTSKVATVNPDINDLFIEYIQIVRKDKGMTIEELSEKSNIVHRTTKRLLYREINHVRMDFASRLLETLDTNFYEFERWKDN